METKEQDVRTTTATSLTDRIYRRAIEAAVWGLPIVSVYSMREAFFRDAKARYGDIVYLSRPSDWKLQFSTPNAASFYAYLNFNTKDEPVVIDVPPAVGAGLFGSISDAWQVPLIDVGPEGKDDGKGARYLIIPPHYSERVPGNFIPVHAETYNGYAVFRIINFSTSWQDTRNAVTLAKSIRTYPLSKEENPPDQKYIDISGKVFDGIVSFDDSFFDALAAMINDEPVQAPDMMEMALLKSIGIEKGKPFKPDAETREIMRRAMKQTHQTLMNDLMNGFTPYWENTHWGTMPVTGPTTGFSFFTPNGLYAVDDRATTFFMMCAPPRKLGTATFLLGVTMDADGNAFDGRNMYHLRIPAKVPAKRYWAITVYDLSTAAFIKDSPSLSIDCYNTDMQRNDDGSLDVYFGPRPPDGDDRNWIYTEPGKPWFALFRMYGPDKSVFDKTWSMKDIRRIL